MRDNRARAERWKRLRRANGIPERGMEGKKTDGATMRKGRKERPPAVDVDGVEVVPMGGVGVKVGAMIPQAATCVLQQPLVQRLTEKSGKYRRLRGKQTRPRQIGRIGLPGINVSSFRTQYPYTPNNHFHSFLPYDAKGCPPGLKSPSASEPDKEGP